MGVCGRLSSSRDPGLVQVVANLESHMYSFDIQKPGKSKEIVAHRGKLNLFINKVKLFCQIVKEGSIFRPC